MTGTVDFNKNKVSIFLTVSEVDKWSMKAVIIQSVNTICSCICL